MKVKELIEILQKMDQEKEVHIRNYEYGAYYDVGRVEEDHDKVVVFPN